MTEYEIPAGDICLHARSEGDPAGRALILAHALGTDLTIWDDILPLLPKSLHIIRYDLRGHGQSGRGDPPDGLPLAYRMGRLIADAEVVCDHLGIRSAIFPGLSVGGLVAQGLAVKRPDLVSSLILSHTAAKIGTPALWDGRIAAILRDGLDPHIDAILERWLHRDHRDGPIAKRLRAILERTDPAGYAATCAAISGTDFYTPLSGLRIPTLGLAGSDDRSTPPDLVRETVDLIPGSRFTLIRKSGHLSPLEQPGTYAEAIATFIANQG